MGENGKQGHERIIRMVKSHLKFCKELPLFRGQINVMQLAKDVGIHRKNLYDNEEVIQLINREAKRRGIPLLPLPHERNETARANRAECQHIAKPLDIKVSERRIIGLEKQILELDNQVKDLTTENHRLQGKVDLLERQQFLDDMALQGRPVRDTMRQRQ